MIYAAVLRAFFFGAAAAPPLLLVVGAVAGLRFCPLVTVDVVAVGVDESDEAFLAAAAATACRRLVPRPLPFLLPFALALLLSFKVDFFSSLANLVATLFGLDNTDFLLPAPPFLAPFLLFFAAFDVLASLASAAESADANNDNVGNELNNGNATLSCVLMKMA
jgi:hypothetical protein